MLFAIAALRAKKKDTLRYSLNNWVLIRSVLITTTFVAFYAAIPFLSLSTLGAANYIAPIFVALLTAYVLRVSVGLIRWIGVIIGFVGVLFLLRPGSDAFSAWTLLPIVGAGFYASAHIITRLKCSEVPLSSMTLTLNTVMCLVGISVSIVIALLPIAPEWSNQYGYLLGAWSDVGLREWLFLGLLAVFSIIIGMMLAGAYQTAPPPIVATFEYSYLVFAAIWDVLIFNITLSVFSLVGMGLIVFAGLLVINPQKKES